MENKDNPLGNEAIPLPDKVKDRAKVLLSAVQLAQNNLQTYMQGYIDSLDSDIQYKLDTRIWCLIPQEEKKEAKDAKR